ncbi:MAG TPA: hypothetical protein G4N92_07025 [Anaerolineae bacterium]|nr:hypothetical protein [Anaerolineae bacterium]
MSDQAIGIFIGSALPGGLRMSEIYVGIQSLCDCDVLRNFFAGSLFSIINWWLEEEPPYSAQEMARMFRQLVMLNRTQLIGV